MAGGGTVAAVGGGVAGVGGIAESAATALDGAADFASSGQLPNLTAMATAYALGDVSPEAPDALSEQLRADPAFSPATALALLAFTILYAPCFVTVAVMAREASWLWAGFAVVANTALGFAVAVAVYQLGKNL